ncbi:neuropilin and tolloid-like protein 2 [Anoplophora glabripennis]|uniref:neuropilin and tolloid-like protein 2 n=1 Tax=Anoplophora glabripennis TaxID=217634 RepID=UPI000C77D5C8|nr:neuropilin and tolloid-like protein 2 [Anoplophora glabripennis]
MAPSQHLIKLDFRDYFRIEHSTNCMNDFLEIRDGRHGYNKIKEHPFCGENFPPLITSSDRHLWIHFKSDDNIEDKGFKAIYEFVPRPPSLKTPEIIPCYINLTQPYEGFLERGDIPSYIIDFNIKHDLPIDCLWNITVEENWGIYLQFDKFTLERPNDCDSNFVQVFSNSTDTQQIKMFCGSIADTVLSKSNKMFLRFYSVSKNEKTMFKANYTAYRDIISGKEDKCNSDDQFYCEDATCIHKSLECNDKFNCRSRFDEDGCQYLKIGLCRYD